MNSLDWQSPANDNERRCEQCGKALNGPASKRYCGKACSSKAKRIRDKDAGKHHNDGAAEHTCEHCGQTFRRRKGKKNAARFCSRECGFVAKSNLMPEHRVSPELREASEHLKVRVSITRVICRSCTGRFTYTGRSAVYCSDACRPNPSNDNRKPRGCSECNGIFVPSHGAQIYCSPGCNKSAQKERRRVSGRKAASRLARKLAERSATVESVNPLSVFSRDKWTCQLCGVKTPKKLRGTYDDRAPELDHIIPISIGGEHSYRNTQCACRKCNSDKGNTPMGQMRLFG